MLHKIDWIEMAIGLGILGSFVSCSYNEVLDHKHEIWKEEHKAPVVLEAPKVIV